MKIVVGTRGSELAVSQTKLVLDMLSKKNPQLEFEIKVIKTRGDILLDRPISQLGGKNIFIKEIERALLDGEIQMAIHSMKDMPGDLPRGLKLSYSPIREDHRDVLVLSQPIRSLDDLPRGARIGTGSKRRKYQLLEYRQDLEIVPIRGNIQTRIRKIEEENLHGVVLAMAGINRSSIGVENPIYPLEEDIMISSPTQGILGIEIREDDLELDQIIRSISHTETEFQARAERAFLRETGGSCKIPVGAYGSIRDREMELVGILGLEDGSKLVRGKLVGSLEEAESLGSKLAQLLIEELR